MHDGPDAIIFELAGHLSDRGARELEQARRTASSTARGRSLIIELTRQSHPLIAKTARSQTWLPVLVASFFAVVSLFTPTRTLAADLSPETVQMWERYIKTVDDRNQMHLVAGNPFLSLDSIPGQAARLRDGEIVVSPAGPHVPIKVPSGLIHDWTGAIFIPGVTLSDVLRVVRDYEQYKDIYHPNVVDSKPTGTGEWQDRFSLLLMNNSLFAKAALDTDLPMLLHAR